MKDLAANLRRSMMTQLVILATLLPGITFYPVPVQANPSGASVVAGGVNISGLGTSTVNINQNTPTAIINWQDFSIAAGEVTNFNQPGVNSLALNRVVTGNPSAIYGQLNANGGVMVINPNGIVVGPSGVIDVAGMLTLSTLDIDNDDFLNGGANRFRGSSSAGIANYGAISGGDVVMLGNFLQNEGDVSAPDGTVVFGAGGDIVVQKDVSGASISVLGAGPGGAVGIDNSGTIDAAAAELKAHGNVYALAIQNDGVIRANGYTTRGGRVMLSASSYGSVVNTGQVYAQNRDGSGGQISVEGSNVVVDQGTLDASGAAGMAGGSVDVIGNNVVVNEAASIDVSGSVGGSVNIEGSQMASMNGSIAATGALGNGGSVDVSGAQTEIGSQARIDVSGKDDGGGLRIGGGYQGADDDIINSDSTTVNEGALIIADGEDGNGGRVVIWSDGDTLYKGDVSAQAFGYHNGGFVEVSGKQTLAYDGTVTTASRFGQVGTLLLDPTDVVIGTTLGGAVTITAASIVAALDVNNVVIHTTGNTPGDSGDITILNGAAILYDEANDLTLFAHRNITFNDSVQNVGNGNINVFAGWTGAGSGTFLGATTPAIAGGNISAGIDFATLSVGAAGTFGDWGQNGGDVIINPFGETAVSVGSARGETNVFGEDIFVLGGNGNGRPGQIGFRRVQSLGNQNNIDGTINVRAKGDITLNAGGASSAGGNTDSYAMIGHGGSRQGTNPADASGGQIQNNRARSGNISVVAEGTLTLQNSVAVRGFAKIGHGGHRANGNTTGDIAVTANRLEFVDTSTTTNNRNQNFMQIGNGGSETVGIHTGDISVNVTTDIVGTGGSATAGTGNGRFIQIGNGGWYSGVVFHLPEVTIPGDSDNDLSTRNGIGLIGVMDVGANVTVGGMVEQHPDSSFRDPNSFNQYGANPNMGGHSGAVSIVAGGNITMTAGGRANQFLQFGHGGTRSHGNHTFTSTTGNAANDGLLVMAGGDITFERNVTTGTPENATAPQTLARNTNSYIHIGLGGLDAGGRMDGDITIDAGGKFVMKAGANQAYAQVGNGGVQSNGTNTGSIVLAGNSTEGFTITPTDLTSAANTGLIYNFDGNGNVTQAGNSGPFVPTLSSRNAHGTLSGDITVKTGGNVEIYGGYDGTNAYAMIGHGGVQRVADYLVNGNPVAVSETGHHGDILVDAGGSVVVSAKPEVGGNIDNIVGERNFAMIGHGGWRSPGDHWGKITVESDMNVSLFTSDVGWEGFNPAASNGAGQFNQSRARLNFSMIGHGGSDSNLHNDLDGFSNGNLGYLFNGNRNGLGLGQPGDSTISVTAQGDLSLIGPQAQGIRSATIWAREDDVVSDGQPDAGALRPARPLSILNFAMIGHGGDGETDAQRTMRLGSEVDGDISVTVGGNITMEGLDVEQVEASPFTSNDANIEFHNLNFTMIGNGGSNIRSAYEGTIDVIAGGFIDLQAGRGLRDFSRIGHGGNNGGNGGAFSSTMVGDISVISGASLFLRGGNGIGGGTGANRDTTRVQFNYAQIGHGTSLNVQAVDANITVAATNDIQLLAGTGWRDSYAHIGNGALEDASGDLSGTIDVTAGDNIVLTNRSGRVELIGSANSVTESAYSKIGHGDSDTARRVKSTGNWTGDIFVKAGNDITSSGGLIGHIDPLNGDTEARSTSGNTFIAVGRDTALVDAGTLTATVGLESTRPTQFTSAFLGAAGTGGELRLYTTSSTGNQIAAGTLLNNTAYTTTPASGSGRGDEQFGTEFVLGIGGNGEPVGVFTPEGLYPNPNGFGPYNIYFNNAFVPPPPPVQLPSLLTDALRIVLNQRFDEVLATEAGDRTNYLYYVDGNDEYIVALSPDQSLVGNEPVEGELYYTFAEDALDSVFGPRRDTSPLDAVRIIDEEQAEELLRRQRFANRPVGEGRITFFVFDPSTGRYSSLRVFGVPASRLGITASTSE